MAGRRGPIKLTRDFKCRSGREQMRRGSPFEGRSRIPVEDVSQTPDPPEQGSSGGSLRSRTEELA